MVLTDNGTNGWPHSGPATLVQGQIFGTFQVIDGLLVATFEQPGGSGQNAGLVFAAAASDGHIGRGFYDQVYGGEEIDSGVLVFGVKGGC